MNESWIRIPLSTVESVQSEENILSAVFVNETISTKADKKMHGKSRNQHWEIYLSSANCECNEMG